jgi:integrase
MAFLDNTTGLWRAQSKSNGKRISQSFKTKEEAMAWQEEHVQHALKVKLNPKLSNIKFRDMADTYTASFEFKQLKDSSRSTEILRIERLKKYFGEMQLEAIDEEILERYRDKRLKEKAKRKETTMSAGAVTAELSCISKIFIYAINKRIVKRNPAMMVKRPRVKQKDIRITNAEMEIILNSAIDCGNPKIGAYFHLLAVLACRPGELAGLLTEDINIKDKTLLFRDTKNGTNRVAVPTDEAFQMFKMLWLDNPDRDKNSPYIFYTKTGTDYKPFSFTNALKCVKTNITKWEKEINPKITCHSFRHEGISRLVENKGLSTAQIMIISGHKSISQMMQYTHVSAVSFKQDIENTFTKVKKGKA